MYYMLTDFSAANWLYHYDPKFLEEHETATQSSQEQYLISLYWALATVSTVGYGIT